MLTKDKAHEIFEYKDGVLYWKNPTGRRAKAGNVAGSKTTKGYMSVMINNKRSYVHRVVYLMHYGEVSGDIDHINGIKSDNRIENLRAATRSQNLCNTRARGETKGVYWNRRDKRWIAQLCFQGSRTHIKYTRATSVGYNTGKVIIGRCFIPKSKPMTESEYFIQGIVRGRGLPADRMLGDVWLKVKSIFRREA